MSDFTFHSPHWLWLLGLLPLLWWLRSRRGADVLVVPFAGVALGFAAAWLCRRWLAPTTVTQGAQS